MAKLWRLLGGIVIGVAILNVLHFAFKTPPRSTNGRIPSLRTVTSIRKAGIATREELQCEDITPQCGVWAAADECHKNVGFMLSTCKASCGICDVHLWNDGPVGSTVELSSGALMPRVGFGTAGLGSLAKASTEQALRVGYRHIDSAQSRLWYREDLVGAAVKESKISRKDLFLTSKLHPADLGYNSTMRKFDISLRELGTNYLDLFLLHYSKCWDSVCEKGISQEGTWEDSWEALEELVRQGKVKDIGVSNFSIDELARLLNIARVPPSVVQSHSDVLSANSLLQKYCKMHGIQFVAYSSLGTQHTQTSPGQNPVLTNPVVMDLAKKLRVSPAQIVLRWGLQQGQVVIPRSSNEHRVRENLDLFSFTLDREAMVRLDTLDVS
ncbi:hypothetical protein BSKO_11344 [Bryopsis sp. KO-2023]|nr:hypothetical protein BSKO_11344 [Bryopsis sp. KO-2023]